MATSEQVDGLLLSLVTPPPSAAVKCLLVNHRTHGFSIVQGAMGICVSTARYEASSSKRPASDGQLRNEPVAAAAQPLPAQPFQQQQQPEPSTQHGPIEQQAHSLPEAVTAAVQAALAAAEADGNLRKHHPAGTGGSQHMVFTSAGKADGIDADLGKAIAEAVAMAQQAQAQQAGGRPGTSGSRFVFRSAGGGAGNGSAAAMAELISELEHAAQAAAGVRASGGSSRANGGSGSRGPDSSWTFVEVSGDEPIHFTTTATAAPPPAGSRAAQEKLRGERAAP